MSSSALVAAWPKATSLFTICLIFRGMPLFPLTTCHHAILSSCRGSWSRNLHEWTLHLLLASDTTVGPHKLWRCIRCGYKQYQTEKPSPELKQAVWMLGSDGLPSYEVMLTCDDLVVRQVMES